MRSQTLIDIDEQKAIITKLESCKVDYLRALYERNEARAEHDRLAKQKRYIENTNMSKRIIDGGPAFPVTGCRDGMSLRDYLASQEQINDVENLSLELLESLAGKRPEGTWSSNPLEWFDWSNRWQSAVKYARADAMLAAR